MAGSLHDHDPVFIYFQIVLVRAVIKFDNSTNQYNLEVYENGVMIMQASSHEAARVESNQLNIKTGSTVYRNALNHTQEIKDPDAYYAKLVREIAAKKFVPIRW